MAELSMTVTNSINFFGGQVTYKWGSTADKSLVWGVGFWGDGPDSNVISGKDITKVYGDNLFVSGVVFKEPAKFLSDSLVVSNVVYKVPEKVIESPVTLTEDILRDVDKIIANSISVSGDMYSEEKLLGPWRYVVEGSSTNFEDRPSNTWTSGTNTAIVYVSGSAQATSWVVA
jgi:hypothetical protein